MWRRRLFDDIRVLRGKNPEGIRKVLLFDGPSRIEQETESFIAKKKLKHIKGKDFQPG